MPIRRKESTAIINALLGGVVPRIGLQHIVVGRKKEIAAFIENLQEVEEGSSTVKFWIGDYGSGKSFMLHLMRSAALERNFVVADVDFSPDHRLYSTTGKAQATYAELINNLAIKTKRENAIETLLEKCIHKIIMETAEKEGFSPHEISPQDQKIIERRIIASLNQLSDVGGYDFGIVISRYFKGYLENDDQLQRCAIKWLRGEYATRTEANRDLGVRKIIDDHNYYDMLKNFADFVVSIGYQGLMINFDEAVNIFKITNTKSRESNYEKILAIYNDCLQGKASHLFVNFSGTHEFLEDERRGLYSYDALFTRLQPNRFEDREARDFSQPIIRLTPLDHSELFALLKILLNIYQEHHHIKLDIHSQEIHQFMEDIYNRPGAKDLLTPRDVIKDFLHALNIIRQNPNYQRENIFQKTAKQGSEDSSLESRFLVEEL